jgi:hypothetical protein
MFVALAGAQDIVRPHWMDDECIVMSGSWESLAYRARRLGQMDFMLPADRYEVYRREQSQGTLDALKKLGANLVMIPCYGGFGYQTERVGMEEARAFAELAHRSGMRVGARIGGALGHESLYREMPEAKAWTVLQPNGEPLRYSEAEPWRYLAVRSHPGFNDHLKRAVRFAAEEMKADLVYFADLGKGTASWDIHTVRQFQDFIAERGFQNSHRTKPPADIRQGGDLGQHWQDYRCRALTAHFREMARYANSLNPQCAAACDVGGPVADAAALQSGVDRAALLMWSRAFRDESAGAGWENGRPVTRIRQLKLGQAFDNSVLVNSEMPLDVAESMAFNLNCLGLIAWFENGEVTSARRGESGRLSPYLKPYVDFFLKHPEFYRRTARAPDVAVLHTHQTLASAEECKAIHDAEQALIESQTAFAILTDQTAPNFTAFRTLLLPDDRRLEASTRRAIEDFRALGGEALPANTLAGDPQRARERLRGRLRVEVTAPNAVAAEVAERRAVPEVLVHLVNYNVEQPVPNVAIVVRAQRLTVPLEVEYWNPLKPEPVKLKAERRRNELRLNVPRLDVYGLVVVRGALL